MKFYKIQCFNFQGVPSDPAPFLQFLRRTKSLTLVDSGPVVVHCSAGKLSCIKTFKNLVQ